MLRRKYYLVAFRYTFQRTVKNKVSVCEDKLGRILIYLPKTIKTISDLNYLEEVVKSIFIQQQTPNVAEKLNSFQILSFCCVKPTRAERRRMDKHE